MNAAVMMEADTPEIKTLKRKKQDSERKLMVFQEAVDRAKSRLALAKAKRLENLDPDKASDFLIAERLAETNLESCTEPFRVCRANIETIEKQIDAAKAAWRASEKARILAELRQANHSFDEQQLAVQKKRIVLTNAALERLHTLDPSFAPILSYGNPHFYLTDDVLVGQHLPSIEILDHRCEFKWLTLKERIRS